MPLVRSYHTLSPVTKIAPPSGATLLGPHDWSGRLLSVALASESLRLGITQQPTLWSPDFPPASFDTSEHLSTSNSSSI